MPRCNFPALVLLPLVTSAPAPCATGAAADALATLGITERDAGNASDRHGGTYRCAALPCRSLV